MKYTEDDFWFGAGWQQEVVQRWREEGGALGGSELLGSNAAVAVQAERDGGAEAGKAATPGPPARTVNIPLYKT